MFDSPAWRVDPWAGADSFRKIRQQSDTVRELLSDESVFAQRSSGISLWSAGEHAGHIAMVNLRMAKAIASTLGRPAVHRDEILPATTTALLEAGEAPRGVAQAPAMVRPEGRTREEFLSILEEAVACWAGLAIRADEIVSCPGRFEHSRLGFMNPAEWVRMSTLHSAHHLRIVNDILDQRAESLDPKAC